MAKQGPDLFWENENQPAFSTLKQMCFGMAQLHRSLNIGYEEKGAQLFADIPKLHAFLHCALASSYLSPRLTCCFRQEDNMNVHRTLAQSCCRGIRGPQVTAKMVAKMRIALHLQLERMWKRKQSSYARWWFQLIYFHPYLQKIPIFTNIFQMGRNHHLAWVGGWGKQRNAYCDMCAKSTLCQM